MLARTMSCSGSPLDISRSTADDWATHSDKATMRTAPHKLAAPPLLPAKFWGDDDNDDDDTAGDNGDDGAGSEV